MDACYLRKTLVNLDGVAGYKGIGIFVAHIGFTPIN